MSTREHSRSPWRTAFESLVASRGARAAGDESVSLSRNAKGLTQIEVQARAQEGENLGDVKDRAVAIYNALRDLYPMPDGTPGAENTELVADGA